MDTKDKVFKEHLQEWLEAKGNRKKRGEIASHMVFATKCHPKSVWRTFKRLQLLETKPERRGRPRYYGATITAALRELWEAKESPKTLVFASRSEPRERLENRRHVET